MAIPVQIWAWLLMLAVLTGCSGGSGSSGGDDNTVPPVTLDTTAPEVVSADPADGATHVELSSAVSVNFSEPMDGSTLNATSFTLTGPTGVVEGSVNASELTATFSASAPLETNTTYTATITTAALDMAGNFLAAEHGWSFTTRPWTRQFGTAGDEYGRGVATDAAGNIYVAGSTTGSLDGNANAGGNDLVVIKYAADGKQLWAHQVGSTAEEIGTGVAIGNDGSVYVAGYTYGDLEGNTNAGGADLFIIKYDTEGTKQWSVQHGTAADDFAYGVTIDLNDNLFVAGNTAGSLNLLGNAGGHDIFVIKYNSTGTIKWTKQVGTINDDYGSGLTTDVNGNIYVAGYTAGVLGDLNAGGNDLVVVAYNPAGKQKWIQQLGTVTDDYGLGIVTDAAANVYIAGHTAGDLDTNVGSGGADLFLVKYNSAGAKQWTTQLGSASDDYGNSVTADASGNLYVAGYTFGSLEGNSSAGENDLFIVKVDGGGTRQWTRQLGTATDDFGSAIATDTSGNLYVVGDTSEGLDGNTGAGSSDFFIVKYQADGSKR